MSSATKVSTGFKIAAYIISLQILTLAFILGFWLMEVGRSEAYAARRTFVLALLSVGMFVSPFVAEAYARFKHGQGVAS